MKWAVISCPTSGANGPSKDSVVFSVRVRSHGRNDRHHLITLANLNYALAYTSDYNRLKRYRVAGVVASREGSDDDARERLYNLSVHGESAVRSVWEDARDGAVVGFIMKRVALPQHSEYVLHYDGRPTHLVIPEDASFDRKNPFQVVPWCSPIASGPSEAELQYVDKEGVVACGTFIPFGVVAECVHNGNAFADVRGVVNLVKVNLCIFGETDLHPRELETAFHERFPPPP